MNKNEKKLLKGSTSLTQTLPTKLNHSIIKQTLKNSVKKLILILLIGTCTWFRKWFLYAEYALT